MSCQIHLPWMAVAAMLFQWNLLCTWQSSMVKTALCYLHRSSRTLQEQHCLPWTPSEATSAFHWRSSLRGKSDTPELSAAPTSEGPILLGAEGKWWDQVCLSALSFCRMSHTMISQGHSHMFPYDLPLTPLYSAVGEEELYASPISPK